MSTDLKDFFDEKRIKKSKFKVGYGQDFAIALFKNDKTIHDCSKEQIIFLAERHEILPYGLSLKVWAIIDGQLPYGDGV